MRRAHVVLLVAVASTALLLITVSMMTDHGLSQAAPLMQATSESEPNNSCSQANEIGLAAAVQGAINPITDTDWFYMTTQPGVSYIGRASVGPAEFSIRLCVHTDSCAEMSCSSASTSYVEQSWDATGDIYYLKVEKHDSALITETTLYVLDVVEQYIPPSTNTPAPTSTPIPGEDSYEQNDSFDQVYTMTVQTSVTLGNATFAPAGDEDWFTFWAKDGKWYQVTTSDLNDADTLVWIYDRNNEMKAKNDDGAGGYASKIKWEAKYEGYYYIRVTNKVATVGSYDLTMEKVSGPSPDPSSTPANVDSKADSCEDNSDFEYACVIPVNESKTFNLVPPLGGVDNDFFRTWVKPGFLFECATSDLSPGVDPNMIVFSGPSWDDAIGGNDDVETGNYNSFFSYYATYEGWLYLLVGTGDRTPSDIYNSNYTLRCDMRVPGETGTPTITGTPDPQAATPTPDSQAATPTPSGPSIASPTPSENITVRPLTTPTPVSVTTPAPRFVPISLLVYYDGNGDHQPGAGEGIAGISAQAYEVATNQLLAQGFTDEQGNLEFTVASSGPVRVSVPFFGFSQLVTGEGSSIYLRVPPQPLPGGAP